MHLGAVGITMTPQHVSHFVEERTTRPWSGYFHQHENTYLSWKASSTVWGVGMFNRRCCDSAVYECMDAIKDVLYPKE